VMLQYELAGAQVQAAVEMRKLFQSNCRSLDGKCSHGELDGPIVVLPAESIEVRDVSYIMLGHVGHQIPGCAHLPGNGLSHPVQRLAFDGSILGKIRQRRRCYTGARQAFSISETANKLLDVFSGDSATAPATRDLA